MKTKEFIKRVEELGFIVKVYDEVIYVEFKGEKYYEPVASISRKTYCKINTSYNAQERLSEDTSQELYSIVFEYVLTPLEEREEPKKYYLRLPNHDKDVSLNYLNVDRTSGHFYIDNNMNGITLKTQFTQEEIDKLPNQDFIQSLIKEEVEWLN